MAVSEINGIRYCHFVIYKMSTFCVNKLTLYKKCATLVADNLNHI